MNDSEYIKISPEAVKSVHLRNDAVKLAKEGDFSDAIDLALTIAKLDFKLNLIFKDEALLEILYWICEAKQFEIAFRCVENIQSPQHHNYASKLLESYINPTDN